MLDAAILALQNIFGCPCYLEIFPAAIVMLLAGVFFGLFLGAMPGLGGLVGLAIILPFTFDMDTTSALAIMIGVTAVVSTSDTIPAVLFGVPGTASAQATVMDGHPMAVKGEAGRAFGAAYMSSLIGGLVGATLLAVSIPILRPLVLLFGSPEFFMLGLLGISMVAVLAGSAPIKGLVAGAIGLVVGTVGSDPQLGELRYAFGRLYLWEHVPLVPVALGLFAIPEMVDLVIKGTKIANVPTERMKGVMVGIKDAFDNWFLVVRCSVLGTWVGFIPGLGASVVDWFAYGHAMQTEKGARETFTKGDVRGVIAPESANNAREGGALIPTVAFGIPGSSSMALILGGFMIQGIQPGPSMLTEHLDLTYTLVWSLALANVFGTITLMFLTSQMAKLTQVRIHILAPIVLAIVFLAAFQATASMGDLAVLMSAGTLGWLMKRFSWPRPPLILGLVLSNILERNLWISTNRYGLDWLGRPFVITIFILIVVSLAYGFWMANKSNDKQEPAVVSGN
jgi:TctA family transporter